MTFLEKLLDFVLKKNYIIAFVSFIFSVIVLICIPCCIYNLLPFNYEVNVIIIFVAIFLLIYLIIYGLIKLIKNRYYKSKQDKFYNEELKKYNEEIIEQYRIFFDSIDDEEYSIIMFFISTENKKPYKDWGYRSYTILRDSIFGAGVVNEWFYYNESYDEAPLSTSKDVYGNVVSMRPLGPCKKYQLKSEYYDLFKYIFDTYGRLSHFERKVVELKYDNKIE